MFFEAGVDGRVLSTLTKGDMSSLARKASVDKVTRRGLYHAVKELKDGGEGGEWVALHGSEC